MSKIKINNEYAIRIIHPTLGIYYYSYCGLNDKFRSFVFTKKLQKVQTWKTEKFAEKTIDYILSKMEDHKGKIYMSLGLELSDNIDKDLKQNVIMSRQKYYYSVESTKNIRTKINLINAEKNNNNLIRTLIYDSERINYMYDDIKQCFFNNTINILSDDNIDFDKILNESDDTLSSLTAFNEIQNELTIKVKKYNSDIIFYKENCEIIETHNNYEGLYLDIIDASHGFRKLKLQSLNLLQDVE